MDPRPPDDDPTHALDDFVRRMRPAAARPAALDDLPDLSGLQGNLHGQRPAAPPKGGTLRSGQTWGPDDVVDVVLPPVRMSSVVDPAALDDSLRQASQTVHS